MHLDRLELAGFFHFNDRAALDLRTVPDGLIAVVGPNGQGKTRFLDSALGSLYGPGAQTNAFPSRDGPLAEYATSREAYIESLWTVEAQGVYRVRVNVDGERRVTDAVLEKQLPDGLFHPLNDGKTSTFREALAEVFPSRRQVLASAFAAQGRQGSFVALDQKGRMDLFAELCDLAHYAEKHELAKRVTAAASNARAALLSAQALLEREAGDAVVEALRAQRIIIEQDVENVHRVEEEHRAAVGELEAEREPAVAAAAAYVAAAERVAAATRDVALQERHLERILTSKKAAVVAAQQETAAASARTTAAVIAHAKTAKYLEIRITNNQGLIARKAEIEAAVVNKRAAEAQLVTLRAELVKHRATLDALRAEEIDVGTKLSQVALAKTNHEHAQRQAETVETVPCKGQGKYAACRFLTLAATAKEQLPALAATLGTEPELVTRAHAAQEARAAAARTIQEIERTVTAAEAIAASKDAQFEASLRAAEEKIAGYKRELELAEGTLKAAQEAADEAVAATAARLRARIEELDAEQRHAEEAKAGAAAALMEARQRVAETEAAKAALDRLNIALATARGAHAAAAAAAARAEAGLEALTAREADLAGKRTQLAEATVRLRTVDDELLLWSLLVKAFGRDGLPKLEVDAAGPTVSNFCNDLLTATHGSRFSIEVVTQVAKADGKGLKEHFDVLVFDNEYGGEPRSITDLSGGERVVVEEALRGAIALYVNARNQRPVRTMWRDETTGALDPENRVRYMAMLRRLQQIGGFQHVLFVTHDVDVMALADAQVHVEAGQPTVVLPPYREAA